MLRQPQNSKVHNKTMTRLRIGRNKGRCLTEKREAKCEREGR